MRLRCISLRLTLQSLFSSFFSFDSHITQLAQITRFKTKSTYQLTLCNDNRFYRQSAYQSRMWNLRNMLYYSLVYLTEQIQPCWSIEYELINAKNWCFLSDWFKNIICQHIFIPNWLLGWLKIKFLAIYVKITSIT